MKMYQHPVHPRLRGELGCSGGALSLLDGSSPLTRGTRRPRDLQLFDHRFIPAYAGNSGANPNVLTPTAVHPRLRGELTSTIFLPFFLVRFIPAYAGNSPPIDGDSTSGTVHPRLRGELWRAETRPLSTNGSSPLTRGTHLNKA